MSFAAPGCANSSGLTSIEPVSTVWSTQPVHPLLSSNTERQTSDRHHPAVCLNSESANVNAYHPALSTARNPWSSKLSGIQEAVFTGSDASSNHVGHLGELITFQSCAAPGGICHAFQGTPAFGELGTPFTTVRVTCATIGCNYGGPLHQTCLQRWNSCCELKSRMLVNTQRLSATGTTTSENPSASHNENSSNTSLVDELCSLYQCPRCGQCSMCRTSNEGNLCSVAEDPYASMLNAIQYVTQQLNSAQTTAHVQSFRTMPPQSAPAYPMGTPDKTNAPGLANVPNESAVLQEERQAGWQKAWKTCPPSIAQHYQPTPMLRHLSLNTGANTSPMPGFHSSGLDSGLSSATFSIDSSRRSSQNTCNSESSGDMGHHDDGFWSAPPSGLRAVRGVGHGTHGSVPKTDNYFTFEPLSPLKSDSPASTVGGSSEAGESSEGKPVFVSPRHKQGVERTAGESPTTTNSAIGPSTGRKYQSAPGGGPRGLSFWPTDKCRETPNDPSDRRKVVNRKGNIFQPRMSFNVFEKLPAYKRNPYFIHMDDDSCTGNEDTRAFLLAQLTNHRVSEVYCLICHHALTIYDHFPVIDGLFFISPICHRASKASGLRVSWHTNGIAPTFYQNNVLGANCDPEQLEKSEHVQRLLGSTKSVVPPPGCLGPRQQVSVSHLSDQTAFGGPTYRNHSHPPRQERYLHAICMGCMHSATTAKEDCGKSARCRSCNSPWSGSNFIVGGLYTYDIFAASPCCLRQLMCNACEGRLDLRENFSQGSSSETHTTATTQAPSSSSLPAMDDRKSQDLTITTQDTVSTITQSIDKHLTNFPLPFFSQYSQLLTCLFCAKIDYHFVKPFDKRYRTQCSTSN